MMNPIEANSCIYNTQMGYGLPLSGTTTVETLLPTIYGSGITDSKTNTAPIKSESGLTYNNIHQLLPRKRSRETYSSSFNIINPLLSMQLQQQQQFDIEHLISQHMEQVRVEIEENRKRQARRIIEGIEEGMMKRLRAKEDEIRKIGKLNSALEDRVKSLCMENQIWRDLAQTNEAAANAIRTNLEQVLAATTRLGDAAAAVMDDAQSCCGSTGGGGGEEEEVEQRMMVNRAHGKGSSRTSRMCRNCGKGGACVLLLPCRHLCLCTVCGSNLHTCPICKSTKNASVHINMS
ncbi:BOI-related E3 ubiquitin-protein ligase 3 [Tripterygium wilfordii]|uniref:RING-type E3 ubiquitin transferase n=1 Tax=Tripterygium wilfordii TaxID=458696 RepID=A0A7J7C279_TRIWF|nr:probable BOI-related E3 ubiquitin-protein ligase 3 [Tripterygium wilfordii]KAF5728201.1 BOI-related E3 ubiquitin-protein ligase 3 [Tripterygium wilfordii]